MDQEKYINNITLEYLLNPNLYEKINKKNKGNDDQIYKDAIFYRKRICQLTKDMCKGEYINNNFKHIFLNYANNIIYYLKQSDTEFIYQEEYGDFSNNSLNLLLNIYLLHYILVLFYSR